MFLNQIIMENCFQTVTVACFDTSVGTRCAQVDTSAWGPATTYGFLSHDWLDVAT